MKQVIEQKLEKFVGPQLAGVAMQFANYFWVAMIGLVVDFGTLVYLHDVMHVYYLWAAVGGFVTGLAVNYVLSSKYVFKNSKLDSRMVEFLLFSAVGLVGLGLLSASMWALVTLLGVQYLIAKCLATVVVYIWNFVGRKAMYRN